MEQVLFRHSGRDPVLRLAGTHRRLHSGGVPHCRLLPLLWIGVLFFLTFFTSGAERRAAVLTAATPVRPWQYALARLGAALTGTVLQSLAVLLLSAVFYARMFR